jgi:hypothetical protein
MSFHPIPLLSYETVNIEHNTNYATLNIQAAQVSAQKKAHACRAWASFAATPITGFGVFRLNAVQVVTRIFQRISFSNAVWTPP